MLKPRLSRSVVRWIVTYPIAPMIIGLIRVDNACKRFAYFWSVDHTYRTFLGFLKDMLTSEGQLTSIMVHNFFVLSHIIRHSFLAKTCPSLSVIPDCCFKTSKFRSGVLRKLSAVIITIKFGCRTATSDRPVDRQGPARVVLQFYIKRI